ncbi:MAG: winged helix-turn-helix transcriptional regulator [Candidatus Korarchaeota archaeon]|nr:winged helix-turn-helix transcriptional regulator [Candidatus Korarchaeota archaeon]NIU82896.1 ArsR family transcriptional regulator [Candidatus Thorarchaeota archaeon]NIW13345.1 ArsR family transcriptional regulator [Candidatus Thorarchaeota archaeon]
MNIEDVFSSKLRMKILKILMQVGELNVSQIARRLGVNYKTTIEHLRVLEEEGVVKHKIFGRIHMYRLDRASPKTVAIQNLIQVWENQDRISDD